MAFSEKTFLNLPGRSVLRKVGPTSEHRMYRGHQMVFHGGLLHVPQRPCVFACLDELWFGMHGQEDEYRCATSLHEFTHGVDSVQNRHADISHNYVRMETAGFRHQCGTICCCPYDIKIGRQEANLGFEQS